MALHPYIRPFCKYYLEHLTPILFITLVCAIPPIATIFWPSPDTVGDPAGLADARFAITVLAIAIPGAFYLYAAKWFFGRSVLLWRYLCAASRLLKQASPATVRMQLRYKFDCEKSGKRATIIPVKCFYVCLLDRVAGLPHRFSVIPPPDIHKTPFPQHNTKRPAMANILLFEEQALVYSDKHGNAVIVTSKVTLIRDEHE